MDWIAQHHDHTKTAAVCNISAFIDSAAPWDTTTPISSFEHTVNNVLGDRVTVVVSANNQANDNCSTSPARMGYGNECISPGNPSGCLDSTHRTITVGGIDEDDDLWRCAKFNDCQATDPGSNTGRCVNIYAMAHDLKVAANTGYSDYRNTVQQSSGTSFSAPAVAGIAARIIQNTIGPGQVPPPPDVVWSIIRNQAVGLPDNFDQDGVSSNDILLYMSKFQ